LAARRGEKGFSALVREAVDRLLADEVSRKDRIEAALALEGSLDAGAADDLETSVARVRGNWR
jgi:Arc/MetJ-type ribon-helix-helix transcriptional regulator